MNRELDDIRFEISTAQAKLVALRTREAEILAQMEAAAGDDLSDRLIAKIKSMDPRQLAAITITTVRDLLTADKAVSDQELTKACLRAESEGYLTKSWFVDGSDGEEMPLDDETVKEWEATGVLIHPEYGEEISQKEAWFYWSAAHPETNPTPSL